MLKKRNLIFLSLLILGALLINGCGGVVVPSNYTVTFDSQGGSAISSQTVVDDGLATEPKDPTWEGYAFGGWYKESGCINSWDFVNDTVTANVTLYAKWTTANYSYTVIYNGNGSTGGTVPVDSSSPYEYGATVTVLGNTGTLVKTGYTFDGWNTAADGSGTFQAAGSTFNMGTANVTLYAQWIVIGTYTVTYNGNGNMGGVAPTDTYLYQQGESVTVLGAGNLFKPGYLFSGWNTAADGSGTFQAAGSTFNMGTANVTLYAQWTTPTYTVSFDSQGGSAVSSQAVVDGGLVTEPTVPMKTGYTFGGWYKEPECTNAWNFNTDTVTSNVTLYAKWTPLYALRDTGPAGGLIFYVKEGGYSDGWMYLEAAPASTEWTDKEWGSYGTLIGGTETGIGTGQSNTTKIVTWLNSNTDDTNGDVTEKTDRAAYLCNELVVGSGWYFLPNFDDWFLPSKDELNLMYENLKVAEVGGFATNLYWSSSEDDAYYAWVQSFVTGDQYYGVKYNTYRVRAVRAF